MITSQDANWSTGSHFISIDSLMYGIRELNVRDEKFAGHFLLGTVLREVISLYGNSFVGGKAKSRARYGVVIDPTKEPLSMDDFNAKLGRWLTRMFYNASARDSNVDFNAFELISYVHTDFKSFKTALEAHIQNFNSAISNNSDPVLRSEVIATQTKINAIVIELMGMIGDHDKFAERANTLVELLYYERLLIAKSIVSDISVVRLLGALDVDGPMSMNLFHILKTSVGTIVDITGVPGYRISIKELATIIDGVHVSGWKSDISVVTILLPHLVAVSGNG